ncbi:hypothetical protein Acsp02_09050 [Actinoplanes sp. NBRC 103695]|nr:hypothetical protein Acsp02_09050 [Actinoplanes sp. NBRC 103695]
MASGALMFSAPNIDAPSLGSPAGRPNRVGLMAGRGVGDSPGIATGAVGFAAHPVTAVISAGRTTIDRRRIR